MNYADIRSTELEAHLSRLGALVSLTADELSDAEQKITDANARLGQIQAEIERLYIALNEPHIYLLD